MTKKISWISIRLIMKFIIIIEFNDLNNLVSKQGQHSPLVLFSRPNVPGHELSFRFRSQKCFEQPHTFLNAQTSSSYQRLLDYVQPANIVTWHTNNAIWWGVVQPTCSCRCVSWLVSVPWRNWLQTSTTDRWTFLDFDGFGQSPSTDDLFNWSALVA